MVRFYLIALAVIVSSVFVFCILIEVDTVGAHTQIKYYFICISYLEKKKSLSKNKTTKNTTILWTAKPKDQFLLASNKDSAVDLVP